MPRRRFAIITYDPDRVAQIEANADGPSFTWIILQALKGRDYPKERGIINITLMDQVPVRSPRSR